MGSLCFQDSDGDKSDDLVVDVSNEVINAFYVATKLLEIECKINLN